MSLVDKALALIIGGGILIYCLLHLPPDAINGMFELVGSALIWLNVKQLYRDKMFRGVAIAPTAFFDCWGMWNLYYYPHLGQWVSFAGGCSMVVANFVWVCQMIHYGRGEK